MEILDEIPEIKETAEVIEPVLDRGVMVYGVADPYFCGIITGILLDLNDCVTYRVNDKFYYGDELTTESPGVKPIKGLK